MANLQPLSDWKLPWRTIAIAATQRTGSNLLCEYMGQTDCLGKPVEFFNPRVLETLHPDRGETIEDRCRLVMEFGTSDNGVAGLKLFPDHFADLQREIRLSEWFGVPRWVWIQRRDLVGQAISFVMARQRKSFTSGTAPSREALYSGEEIVWALDYFTKGTAQWTAYFARTQLSPVLVYYEDLETDPGEVIRRIAQHVGVDAPQTLQPPRTFQKQRTELTDRWRERFHLEMGRSDQFKIEVVRQPAAAESLLKGQVPPVGKLAGLRERLGSLFKS